MSVARARPAAVLAVAALVGSGLVPALIPREAAAVDQSPPAPILVYAMDVNGDEDHGLYKANLDGTNERPILRDEDPDKPGRDIVEPALSPDGTKVAALVGTDAEGYELKVMDLDGKTLEALAQGTAGQNGDEQESPPPNEPFTELRRPNWAPYGDAILFTEQTTSWSPDGPTFASRLMSVPFPTPSGQEPDRQPVPEGGGLAFGIYAPDRSILASRVSGEDDDNRLELVQLRNGQVTPFAAGADGRGPEARPGSFSPDGTKVTYVKEVTSSGDTGTGDAGTEDDPATQDDTGSEVHVVDATGENDVRLAGATDPDRPRARYVNDYPVWQNAIRDGQRDWTVVFERYDDARLRPSSDLVSAPVTSDDPPLTKVSSAKDASETAPSTIADRDAPSPPTWSWVIPDGEQITLNWRTTDADVAGVEVLRQDGSGEPQPLKTVQRASSYTDTGRVIGTTYTYALRAVDRLGNVSDTSGGHQVTAIATPDVSAPDISAVSTTGLPFRVSWNSKGLEPGKGEAAYHAEWYTTDSSERSPIIGESPVTTDDGAVFGERNAPTSVRMGTTYRFRVSARDEFGNWTPGGWAGTQVGYDFGQGDALGTWSTTRGWTTYRAGDRWLGDVALTRSAGAAVGLRAYASAFTIVGDKCARCGAFQISTYTNGRWVVRRTVDTWASTTRVRQPLASVTLSDAPSWQHVVVKAVGTRGRPQVDIDAIVPLR